MSNSKQTAMCLHCHTAASLTPDEVNGGIACEHCGQSTRWTFDFEPDEPFYCRCRECQHVQQADGDGCMDDCTECGDFSWRILGTKPSSSGKWAF